MKVTIFFIGFGILYYMTYLCITWIFPQTKPNYNKEKEQNTKQKLDSIKIKDIEKYLRSKKLNKIK